MFIAVNGVTLFYEKTGNGPTLLLLHGNGEDHTTFDALTKALKQHFTIYAVDSRNHGQSQQTDIFDYTLMSEDIYAFIVALGLTPASIVGFSDGGIVALLLTMHHPEAVHKMALLGANLTPSDILPTVYQDMQKIYEETKSPLFQLMLEQPNITLAEVQTVPTPTLLVAGEHDIIRLSLYEEMAETMPEASVRIMEGHDHSSYVEHSDLLADPLLKFFT